MIFKLLDKHICIIMLLVMLLLSIAYIIGEF